MMQRTRFTPEIGKVYTNNGGGEYRCMSVRDEGEAKMRNTKSGWTLIAHGCGIYEDGTMDWDYSTGGYFADRR